MPYWYIFWVLTGREKQVEKRIMDRLYNEDVIPFIPMLETLFRRAGKVKKELNIMFPGYVFVESDMQSKEFRERTLQIIRSSKDIIGILSYGNSDEIAVRGNEREALLRFCNDNYCIESSMGFIEGDKVYIESGPMVGMESAIKEINRKKMEASFELEFMGRITRFTVGLELLRKIQNK
jgi:transcriptional antiterminator NusG